MQSINPRIIENIKTLFTQNRNQLVDDLIRHPEHKKTYIQLQKCLSKKIDKNNYIELQSSIHSIQQIAHLLKIGQMKILDTFIKETNGANISYETLSDFLDLNSPENVAKVMAIPNEEARFRVMSKIINRDRIPLNTLNLNQAELMSLVTHLNFDLNSPESVDKVRAIPNEEVRFRLMAKIIDRDKIRLNSLFYLEKTEFMSLARFITYVKFRKEFDFDLDWSMEELEKFLNIASENIQTLEIPFNDKIEELPPLPQCLTLECPGCLLLRHVPHLPNCLTLDCSKCLNLNQLPELPNCQTLRCTHCHFDQLPPLPNCRELRCSECQALHQLPLLLNCESLICDHCPSLQRLPELPLCSYLDCNKCRALQQLPELPVCVKLDCSECQGLQQLPNLPVCINLKCSECRALQHLPELPSCHNLNCYGCLALQQLPDLPVCVSLYCSECRALQHLPELPSCNNLYCSNCPTLDPNSIPLRFRSNLQAVNPQIGVTQAIRWEELQDDPIGVLLNLENSLINRGVIPQIRFIERDGRQSAALDFGGVFRVFVSSLMQSLISHSNEPKQLKFLETDTGLHMPVLDRSRDVDIQMKAFKVLGAIFKICYESASNPARNEGVTTGMCFDAKLFNIITNLTSQELNQINLNTKNLSDEMKLRLLSLSAEGHTQKKLTLLHILPKNMTLEQFHTLKSAALEHIILDQEEKLPPGFDKEKPSPEEMITLALWLQSSLKDALLNRMADLDYWFPALAIAKQMHTMVGSTEGWINLCQQGAAKLNISIQGVISKDALLSDSSNSAIEWVTGDRNLDAEKVNNTKEFVKQWIREATQKDLELLSNFITGSPTLSPSKKIQFQLYNSDPGKLPNTHSCSFEIDLSINYPNYQHFKQKLELALLEANSLETSGLEAI